MRVLFDTNVLLDALLEREPHVRAAAQLFAAVETGAITGLLSATSLTTVFYIVERQQSREWAHEGVRRLLLLFEIAPVTRSVLEDALGLGFHDYEDAVQHEAARYAGSDGMVTRNAADFARAALAVYTPNELLQAVRNA